MAQVNAGGVRGLGVSVKFTGLGATLSLLGNMTQFYPAYVNYIKENAPEVANNVAIKYFNNLSKSKSKDSPFMRTSRNIPYIIGAPVYTNRIIPGHLWSREVVERTQTIDLFLDMLSDPRILWYVEGTSPYDIYPKNKKFLLFYWEKYDDRLIFAKHVHHPGIKKHKSVITDIRRLSYRPLMAMIMKARRMFEVGSGRRMSYEARVRNFGKLNTMLGKTPFDSNKAMSGRSFLSNVFSGKIRGINYV